MRTANETGIIVKNIDVLGHLIAKVPAFLSADHNLRRRAKRDAGKKLTSKSGSGAGSKIAGRVNVADRRAAAGRFRTG